jgi:hypothetical protein
MGPGRLLTCGLIPAGGDESSPCGCEGSALRTRLTRAAPHFSISIENLVDSSKVQPLMPAAHDEHRGQRHAPRSRRLSARTRQLDDLLCRFVGHLHDQCNQPVVFGLDFREEIGERPVAPSVHLALIPGSRPADRFEVDVETERLPREQPFGFDARLARPRRKMCEDVAHGPLPRREALGGGVVECGVEILELPAAVPRVRQ